MLQPYIESTAALSDQFQKNARTLIIPYCSNKTIRCFFKVVSFVKASPILISN